ncbi:MAG: DUF1178 domain-containing protein [Hyphomicrobiales bacterium]|nr:MAG: DUF1178 domain-containing protein [Hyphomicrobiales bacterium]
MIRYSLNCDQGHDFEGWFRDSADFDGQVKSAGLGCPMCGSTEISKKLMAPAVVGTKKGRPALVEAGPVSRSSASDSGTGAAVSAATTPPSLGALAPDQQRMVELARYIRKEVVANADYVGSRFAEEARKIHYGDAEERGIYGETTLEDAEELLEEGVDVMPLPILPEDQN